MEITHKKIPTTEDKVSLEDWIESHNIDISGTFRVPQLIEEKNITSDTNKISFTGLDGDVDLEYFLTGILVKGSQVPDAMWVIFNNDTTSGNYYQYLQLQEVDGAGHHLSNWNSTNTIGRILEGSSTFFNSNIKVVPSVGVLLRSEGVFMYNGGFESFVRYKPASYSNITSISLAVAAGKYFLGKIKLYKMVDLVI